MSIPPSFTYSDDAAMQMQAVMCNCRAAGLLEGSGSQLQRSGPSERAGPSSGAACGASLLLRCYPRHAVRLPVLPASIIHSILLLPMMH